MRLLPIALVSLTLLGNGTSPPEDPVKEIQAVLTDFHAAAAQADADRYLGYLAEDAILFGTDGAERWTFAEYEALVRPYLEQGVKIENHPVEQHVFVSADEHLAWFDERLDKPKYGAMRATGVLRHTDEGWKFVQFHLAYPVPNEILPDVVKLARAAQHGR